MSARKKKAQIEEPQPQPEDANNHLDDDMELSEDEEGKQDDKHLKSKMKSSISSQFQVEQELAAFTFLRQSRRTAPPRAKARDW